MEAVTTGKTSLRHWTLSNLLTHKYLSTLHQMIHLLVKGIVHPKWNSLIYWLLCAWRGGWNFSLLFESQRLTVLQPIDGSCHHTYIDTVDVWPYDKYWCLTVDLTSCSGRNISVVKILHSFSAVSGFVFHMTSCPVILGCYGYFLQSDMFSG